MDPRALSLAYEILASEEANDGIAERVAVKIFEKIGPSEEVDELAHTLAAYKIVVYSLKTALSEAEKNKSILRRLIDKIK